MGYSHTFKMPKPNQTDWGKLVSDVKKLFSCLPTAEQWHHDEIDGPIVLCGPHGDGDPVCTIKEIAFNGDASKDMASETLLLYPGKLDDWCKTSRHPYDFVVCGVLILANHHLPNFKLTSNGRTDAWQPSLDWVQKHINHAVMMPRGILPPVNPPEKVVKMPSKQPDFIALDHLQPIQHINVASQYF
jgi:hypothetical protein